MKKPERPVRPTAPTRIISVTHSKSLNDKNTLAEVFLELPNGIDPETVVFEREENWDGNCEGFRYIWSQEEPNKFYEKNHKTFERALVKWQKAIDKYSMDMVAYEAWLQNHEAEEKVKAIEFHKAKLRELEES
jgi:hypothetical protein